MNKEDTLALWRQGKDDWNAWAEGMLARRAEMEAAGTWAEAAKADFMYQVFEQEANFAGFLFPAGALFRSATFGGNAWFGNATFGGSARFDSATFKGDAWFASSYPSNKNKTKFSGHATFNEATFCSLAQFNEVIFDKGAWFESAKFNGIAEFNFAEFTEGVRFDNVSFINDAYFLGTMFKEADFSKARFEGTASFGRATFKNAASFAAAHGNRRFLLAHAQFDEVPDFDQAHFAEAPRLDYVSTPDVGGIARFLFPWVPGIEARADTSARYRALKRLAIQAHDHTRELDYFANELKALRGHPDALLPCPLNLLRKDEKGQCLPWWPGGCRGTAQYWFGLGYEALSNFGRSMVLPLVWLAVTAVVSAWGYLSIHFAHIVADGRGYGLSSIEWISRWLIAPFTVPAPPLACIEASPGDPWNAAALLSVAKTLPYSGVVPAEKLSEVFRCLYGESIPSCVVVIGMAQLVLSLLLLFLFLLAVRSHFRIR